MSVYVDPAVWPFGRMVMGHLWADSDAELHAFAARLGLRRGWFQAPPKASWKHYDVSAGMRARAIALGAVATDRYGPLEHLAQRRGDAATLARIARLRAERAPAQGALL